MKVQRIFLHILFSFLFMAHLTAQENANIDDGSLGAAYLPQEIASVIRLENDEKPTLMAKYEPKKGAKYYIFNLDTDRLVRTAFFKVENGQAIELSREDEEYPFSRFIKDPQVVNELWKDLLSRWIKRDGRDNLQERLNLRAHEQITEEEAIHFEQAGFKVPPTAQRVKDYGIPQLLAP